MFQTTTIGNDTFLLFADGMVNAADVRSMRYERQDDGNGLRDRLLVVVQFKGDPTLSNSYFRPWDGGRDVVEADSTVS